MREEYERRLNFIKCKVNLSFSTNFDRDYLASKGRKEKLLDKFDLEEIVPSLRVYSVNYLLVRDTIGPISLLYWQGDYRGRCNWFLCSLSICFSVLVQLARSPEYPQRIRVASVFELIFA